jgi:hypothetical protein
VAPCLLGCATRLQFAPRRRGVHPYLVPGFVRGSGIRAVLYAVRGLRLDPRAPEPFFPFPAAPRWPASGPPASAWLPPPPPRGPPPRTAPRPPWPGTRWSAPGSSTGTLPAGPTRPRSPSTRPTAASSTPARASPGRGGPPARGRRRGPWSPSPPGGPAGYLVVRSTGEVEAGGRRAGLALFVHGRRGRRGRAGVRQGHVPLHPPADRTGRGGGGPAGRVPDVGAGAPVGRHPDGVAADRPTTATGWAVLRPVPQPAFVRHNAPREAADFLFYDADLAAPRCSRSGTAIVPSVITRASMSATISRTATRC